MNTTSTIAHISENLKQPQQRQTAKDICLYLLSKFAEELAVQVWQQVLGEHHAKRGPFTAHR